ncbi:class I SAM-dependent methyltransferase [Actinopolymorpha alba]|uniref:class I SAM-dependent methyltransferase n=1 Tax=Actinopolymorpha alba TaxID=533267 RepID=UPI00036EF575|nr:class I SAM-dependent methyltransferase [Actinopolymorpha alba]
MAYRLIDGDPDPADVRHLTFVPFRADGSCVAVPTESGKLTLPAGVVEPGEHYLIDSSLRIPLMTAGFRFQRVTPFAVDGKAGDLHVYAWIEGDRYRGARPHRAVELRTMMADELGGWFAAAGDTFTARVVTDAARSYGTEDDERYYANNLRLLEPAYLRGSTAQEGSGFGGGPQRWREERESIVDGIHKDGTFLDLGCAIGLLMESVRQWAGERGLLIEPYGVDIGAGLVDLARRRLPQWADRIEVGNAIDYVPSDGRRFTFVHALVDCVPERRRRDLIRHAIEHLVEPGGRLLVSHYGGTPGREYLQRSGLAMAGESHRTAWTDVPAPAGAGH